MPYTSIEICAGAGGQALGLDAAGFRHVALVENDPHACATLRKNRPYWNTIDYDLTDWNATQYRGKVDLFAGGVPCPPFSKAGRQLGREDERDLFPTALRLIRQCGPRAVLLENVRGLMDSVFRDYRQSILDALGDEELQLVGEWKLLHAADFGVPQLRPRTLLVALEREAWPFFKWPEGKKRPPTVGEALRDEMASNGWEGAAEWSARADRIAPTLVGGSKKHGGPDLGPTRAKREWATLGVNGHLVWGDPPPPGFEGDPCLTVRMAAVLQGFRPRWDWEFLGGKTNAYRQVGNAFPPPVAEAVGRAIRDALRAADRLRRATPARQAQAA